MKTIHSGRNGSSDHSNTTRGIPWHWVLVAAALLAAVMGGWVLWGPMLIAKPLPPLPNNDFQLRDVANATDLKSLQHKQVDMVGVFTGHTVVLSGRDMAGRSGFYVLEPFIEKGDKGLAVLVQQGWVPSNTPTQRLRTPKHELIIEGRLAIPSFGSGAKAGSETGLIRQSLNLQRYASEIGMPLVPMVVLQEPGAEWSEKDIRQDLFQRRWSELYPQDKNIARNGWLMLIFATALAALGIAIKPNRRRN